MRKIHFYAEKATEFMKSGYVREIVNSIVSKVLRKTDTYFYVIYFFSHAYPRILIGRFLTMNRDSHRPILVRQLSDCGWKQL